MLVTGDAGIGKTRLAAEVAAAASTKGFEVLSGRSIDLVGVELPFQPFVDALRPLGNPFRDEVRGSQLQVFESVLALLSERAAINPCAGRVGGSPLGRRLDARPRRLPGPQRRRRAGGARGDLSLGRAGAGGTRGPADGWCAPLRGSARGRIGAAGRRRSASAARRATPTEERLRQSSTPSSPVRRATRSSPRSCSQPADRGKRCRVACGTCCCAASPSSTGPPATCSGWSRRPAMRSGTRCCGLGRAA